MQKQDTNNRAGAIFAAVCLAAMPMAVSAGGYGTAGVADASVAQHASQGTVWCPKMEQNIPERLFRQMDCGPSEGFAGDQVAGERVTNRRGLGGFFANLRHQPGKVIETDDDNPAPKVVREEKPEPEKEPKPSTSVSKWDRLADFGVTRDNIGQADKSLRDQISDYRKTKSPEDDWSGFNPN